MNQHLKQQVLHNEHTQATTCNVQCVYMYSLTHVKLMHAQLQYISCCALYLFDYTIASYSFRFRQLRQLQSGNNEMTVKIIGTLYRGTLHAVIIIIVSNRVW